MDDNKRILEKNENGELAEPDSSIGENALCYYYALQQLDNSIRAGFQLATKAGPLCDEPMCGVAFIVCNVKFHSKPKHEGDEGSSAAASEENNVVDEGSPTHSFGGFAGIVAYNVQSTDAVSTATDIAQQKNETAALIDEAELRADNSVLMSDFDLSILTSQMGRLSGFVISCMRMACRRAFLQHEQRLVEAYFNTAIQCNCAFYYRKNLG